MMAKHVEISASGQVQPNPSNQGPRGTDPVNVYLVGVCVKGTGQLDLYDGTSASGTPVVSVLGTAGGNTVTLNFELRFTNGMYANLGASTTASIWIL